MIEAIEKLIPAQEKLEQVEGEYGRFRYPNDEVYGIFNHEDVKRNINTIYLLLGEKDIVNWWTTKMDDSEFEKFLTMVQENDLPTCLTSQEEVMRYRAWLKHNYDYMQPAIYKLGDLVYGENKNLDSAFQELTSLYPNEKSKTNS